MRRKTVDGSQGLQISEEERRQRVRVCEREGGKEEREALGADYEAKKDSKRRREDEARSNGA